ncbi:hypothetical protein R1sor_001239 [Riccia sorocarpa]|uniref:CCHC-type domain-containing protein n=1 Tax=Riccia sorocarpa TaxID=122646 RepID=A0ABD3GXT7_9MARC
MSHPRWVPAAVDTADSMLRGGEMRGISRNQGVPRVRGYYKSMMEALKGNSNKAREETMLHSNSLREKENVGDYCTVDQDFERQFPTLAEAETSNAGGGKGKETLPPTGSAWRKDGRRTLEDPNLNNVRILPWTEEDTKMLKLKLVGRQNWILVLETREQRDRVLQSAPLSWGRVTVEVIPWTPDFNPQHESSKRIATWVEIPFSDALLEPLGDKFLHALGKSTFKTLNRGVCKYPNIRGCVMVNQDADLPEKLALQLPDGGVILQEVKYQGAPNTCFRCRQIGHEAKNCPNVTKPSASMQREGVKPKHAEKASPQLPVRSKPLTARSPTPATSCMKTSEFLEVTARHKGGKSKPPESKSPHARPLGKQNSPETDMEENPFHVLAGAFETNIEDFNEEENETADVAET